MSSTAESTIDSATKAVRITKQVTWGRASRAKLSNNVGALLMVTCSPLLVHINWIALEHFHGSLLWSIISLAPFCATWT